MSEKDFKRQFISRLDRTIEKLVKNKGSHTKIPRLVHRQMYKNSGKRMKDKWDKMKSRSM